uniref:NADH-ubiquinone oxidoreductase chain 2 n=1 Tax=Tenebrio obscurus TaxID=27449 RepID=A0A343ULX3_9CUCU|nr:NADH dehydrogenase subunit 2 [Tenebrio obscurus]AVE14885.1 NADH dehydrogenase subunit 2 [Tenebrio obscurus]
MKLYKLMFLTSMVAGTLISISSYSWLSMWMGLEINLLSIIPLFTEKKNVFSTEASLKYFITQAMASLILLMSVIMLLLTNEFINPLMNSTLMLMLNSALMIKLGAAPFHFWFPEVIEGLSWNNALILLTWQKIAPMMLMMNNKMNDQFMMSIMVLSLLTSTIMGFNQTSLRKIMAFSSINHIAWMIGAMMISNSMWMIYFTIYALINFNIIMLFNKSNSFYVNQMNNSMNQNKLIKLSFMINFLSLGGLPPFMGFMPKWMIINWMTESNLMIMALVMIITTLIMLYIYTRIIMSAMMMFTVEMKTSQTKINSTLMTMINTSTLIGLMSCTYLFNSF